MKHWRHHLRKRLDISATNYFKYHTGGAVALPGAYILSFIPSLLKFIHLLHLNQTGVQDLICNQTDAQASTL